MKRNKKQCGCNNPKILNIKWQRLVNEGETCPRCGSTEKELDQAISALKKSLAPLGIKVTLETEELSFSEFMMDPLQSNRIWMNNQPLEYFINGEVGQSPCCNVCGPSDCRTVKVKGETYETISSDLIIQAGLAATTQMIRSSKDESCCGSD